MQKQAQRALKIYLAPAVATRCANITLVQMLTLSIMFQALCSWFYIVPAALVIAQLSRTPANSFAYSRLILEQVSSLLVQGSLAEVGVFSAAILDSLK